MGAVGVDEALDADEAKKVLGRAWRRLSPYRRLVAAGAVLSVLWTGTIVAGPFLVRYGIDRGLRQDDAGALNLAIAVFLGVTVLSYITYRAVIITINQVGENFLRDLRVQVFDHLQALSMPFYDREKAGVVISRMTADVESLSELVQIGLIMFVSNGLLLVITVAVLFAMSWQLALVCLIGLPVVVVASVRFQRESNKAYLTVRDRIGQTLTSLQEGLSGVRVIQAFGREDVEVGRFGRRNQGLFDAHMNSVRISVWYFPVVELSGVVGTAAVIGIGGMFVRDGIVTIGTVAAFVLLLANLFEPIQQLSQLFNTLQSAGAALNKLFGLLDTPVELHEHPGAVDLPRRSDFAIEHVSFAYADGEPVLRDVDLHIASGERLALVGPTGAGKSTLAKLAARLYDPTEGRITYGGVDLRLATLRSLRERMVVVPQEGFLFNGTLADNVRIGRGDATDEDVAAALDAVGALDRFSALPLGLQMPVNARGARLSAGEKQLVSLARAALADPDVLVLDEATSSLDPGTEALVEAAIERLMEDRTVVVIAHRLSTAQRADRVAVVVGGELVELGAHDELVEQGGHYSALFASWAGGLSRQ
ncbi:MAG: ABC transporter ATP-binding protein [Acidimicrobiales bacterium]